MYDSLAHIKALKITVIRRPLKTAHGLWLPEEKTIVLRSGLGALQEREVLAHEVGHALAGHDSDSPANEAVADLYAAQRLIGSRDYAEAILSTRNLAEAAQVLGVSRRLLFAYINGACSSSNVESPNIAFSSCSRLPRDL
jgi:Zn-dependent peptidase ImmA (M78 family)